ncbi:hypothetical protein IWW34DRAFT_737643 [Fusarium oxysporum f. sp. albedinis]|nr:hypothetical protein IWW34DRAFT_737643 [Fusarium oxysporum f. sp. albedinis]
MGGSVRSAAREGVDHVVAKYSGEMSKTHTLPNGGNSDGSLPDGLRRLSGRAAVTILSIWPERMGARVGLPRGQDPEAGHRGWDFGLAVKVGLRSKLVLTYEPAVPCAKSRIGSKGM